MKDSWISSCDSFFRPLQHIWDHKPAAHTSNLQKSIFFLGGQNFPMEARPDRITATTADQSKRACAMLFP